MVEPIRNTDLCALLDGECDAGARARLEAELARSPQCAERLALWGRNDAALRLAVLGGRHAGPTLDAPCLPRGSQAPPEPSLTTDAPPRNVAGALLAGFAGGAACGAAALAMILFG
jgi:anti-sigma factor RsiW